MAKEAIISTERLNCYDTRVITSGIDTEQYSRNPVLLYMHDRGRMPIGHIENLRVENGILYGTPVFDTDTEEERIIAAKWERGTLRMLSAGLEIIELSEDPALLLPGQTRPTISRSKLIEVSIVDIGANDDALQVGLYKEGKILILAAGAESPDIPLLKLSKEEPEPTTQTKKRTMEKILLALGLAPTATEEEAVTAINALRTERDSVNLSRITDAVDTAVKRKRITDDKKEHFIGLGKAVGYDQLKATLDCMTPAMKPTDIINPASKPVGTELKWDTATPEQLEKLRSDNREEYCRLYKEHFGFAPKFD